MSNEEDQGKQPSMVAPGSPGAGKPEDEKSESPVEIQPVRLADSKSKLAKAAKTARNTPKDKIILVPVDFSGYSEAALVFAARLAVSMSARLMILHVVHDPGEMPGYYSKLVKKKRIDRIQNIAKEVFDDFLKGAIARNPGLKTLRNSENLMVTGLPVTRILQVAEKVRPFMVVMGSKGRTGLKHLFLGSKAEQVVHLCPIPVTIVKQKKMKHHLDEA